MTMRAAVEVVSESPESLFDVDSNIRQLVRLAREASEIEKRARQLRTNLKSFLVGNGLTSYQSMDGHKASLVESNRWDADRATAESILSAEEFTTIFKSTHSVSVRVK